MYKVELRPWTHIFEIIGVYDQLNALRTKHSELKLFVREYLTDAIDVQLNTDKEQLAIIQKHIDSGPLTDAQIDAFNNKIEEISRSGDAIDDLLDKLKELK